MKINNIMYEYYITVGGDGSMIVELPQTVNCTSNILSRVIAPMGGNSFARTFDVEFCLFSYNTTALVPLFTPLLAAYKSPLAPSPRARISILSLYCLAFLVTC